MNGSQRILCRPFPHPRMKTSLITCVGCFAETIRGTFRDGGGLLASAEKPTRHCCYWSDIDFRREVRSMQRNVGKQVLKASKLFTSPSLDRMAFPYHRC